MKRLIIYPQQESLNKLFMGCFYKKLIYNWLKTYGAHKIIEKAHRKRLLINKQLEKATLVAFFKLQELFILKKLLLWMLQCSSAISQTKFWSRRSKQFKLHYIYYSYKLKGSMCIYATAFHVFPYLRNKLQKIYNISWLHNLCQLHKLVKKKLVQCKSVRKMKQRCINM